MMNKQTFKELIANSAFKELFITELGWWNPVANFRLPEIIVDEQKFYFEQIARISSFQVLACQVDSIPTSSITKKIDTQLRKQANDYICIYHIPDTEHHLWVVPVKKVEKRDLVLIEYISADKASFLYEKMADLHFDYDEQPTIMDVKERVQAGFIINSERITKDFYAGFRKEHTNFAKFITGIDDYIDKENEDKPKNKQVANRNKQWYTSVMLNRLMFCYFIQKKGFLDRNINYLRDKLAWVRSERGGDRFYGSFYKKFLLSLFHDGLNSPRHEPDFELKFGRIPYLNGGMFSMHELEETYPDIDIADEAFESLFAFFDQWHWHLDDRLTASGKDINPDVLGYIFEQYINDRAQMGAYYTKEDITEYIGRNTIIPYLMDAVKQKDEKLFKTNGELWQFLRDSGDRYIFDAVKKGHDQPIPEEIAVGIDTTQPNHIYLQYKEKENMEHLHVLDAYCIENYMICEDAICNVAYIFHARDTYERVKSILNIPQALNDIAEPLINLFFYYSIQMECYGQFCRMNIDPFIDKSIKQIDSSKIEKRIAEIRKGLINYGIPEEKLDDLFKKRKAKYPYNVDTLLKIVSGKDFLIPYFKYHIDRNLNCALRLPKETWKFNLVDKCDITKLEPLKQAILSA